MLLLQAPRFASLPRRVRILTILYSNYCFCLSVNYPTGKVCLLLTGYPYHLLICSQLGYHRSTNQTREKFAKNRETCYLLL